jgi:surfeit locus 1 family protein
MTARERLTLLQKLQRARLIAPALSSLVVCAILLALGNWQMSRKTWKEALIAERAARSLVAPIDPGARLFDNGSSSDLRIPAEFTRVRLSGRFLHDKERFWFADGPQGSGFHVFTPFEVAPAQVVWVNRGYIPAHLRDPATRAAGQIVEPTTITGVVRQPGERNRFTPANDLSRNVWYWKDLPALQASAFTPDVIFSPIMVDVDAATAPQPGTPQLAPLGGTAQAPLSNRHLEYALTWYALAATLIGVFFVFARGRLARPTDINVNGK